MERPFVHVNCAATLDGKISYPDGSPMRISGEWDMRRVHTLRAKYGSILVGAGTVLADDPKLTVKEEHVPDPPPLMKVVLDGKGRISPGSRFLGTAGRSMVMTTDAVETEWVDAVVGSSEAGEVEVVVLPGEKGIIPIPVVLHELKMRGVMGILVEGGSAVIWQFLRSGLVDRFTIYIGPMMVGGSGPSIAGGAGFPDSTFDLSLVCTTRTEDGGLFLDYVPRC